MQAPDDSNPYVAPNSPTAADSTIPEQAVLEDSFCFAASAISIIVWPLLVMLWAAGDVDNPAGLGCFCMFPLLTGMPVACVNGFYFYRKLVRRSKYCYQSAQRLVLKRIGSTAVLYGIWFFAMRLNSLVDIYTGALWWLTIIFIPPALIC